MSDMEDFITWAMFVISVIGIVLSSALLLAGKGGWIQGVCLVVNLLAFIILGWVLFGKFLGG